MLDTLRWSDAASHEIVRPARAGLILPPLPLKGHFKIQQIRNDEVIAEWDRDNAIVTVGVNLLFNVMFNAASASANWYIGLIDNASFSTLNNADTMASHAGWIENTDYDESNRPEWLADSATSRAITNSTTADFTMNATKTIRGVFITSNNTKGGTSGTLWSTAAFGTNASVVDDDVLKIVYSISA